MYARIFSTPLSHEPGEDDVPGWLIDRLILEIDRLILEFDRLIDWLMDGWIW